MGDEEMQEQTVAAVPDSEEPVNPHDLQKDSSGVEKDQNLGEKPQSSHPEDNTLTLDSDVTLSDAAVGVETDGDAKAGGEKNDDVKLADNSANETNADGENQTETELKTPHPQEKSLVPVAGSDGGKKWKTWLPSDAETGEFDEAGTPEEQEMFMKDLESFHKEHFLEFKPPKFYGQPLNCLKLWRAVIKLGGYDLVTASKLWRQVGESFHPPKTCTTVSWTFRIFYEKALVEYEKYLSANGELELPGLAVLPSSGVEKEASSHQGSGSGRTIRDSAARAMQGWHSQRLGYGEDKGATPTPKREKNLKNIVMQKHRSPNCLVLADKPFSDGDKQGIAEVIDVGPPADWVKINVLETKDCFEIYALVPGLLREEVRVQSDPAGRLVITGQPEQLDNPWGITPFKKVVNLPGRIDPLQTSAIVSLHGRLFVRVPFEH